MDKKTIIVFLLFFVSTCGFAQENGSRNVIITPPNAVIQPGESVTLTASGATFYQWSPAEGLSNTTGPVTVASPIVTTTYTCTGFGQGPELVVNGDFEQGNTGFTSAYRYSTSLGAEGTYYVDSDAHSHHLNFEGHGHGGSGNFMIINGATVSGTNVWTETVPVQPNTNYAFSTYVCTVCAHDEAILQFSINGQQIGDVFTAPNSLNTWLQFYQIWNSGNSTSATITILNQNTTGGGNDFGLDDISFCELGSDSEAYCTVSLEEMAAGNDVVSTCYENTVIIDFLDNDIVFESCNNLSCSIIQQPGHGSASYANGVMQYTPDNGFAGSDSFRYQITCNGQSAEATVNVTVVPRPQRTINQHACESFTWTGYSGQTYSNDGIWQYVKPNPSGCDSLIILNLTIHHATEESLPPIEECDEYTWHGITYTNSGLYDYTTTNEWGCTLLQHLPLTIHHSDTVEMAVDACEEYTWHGVTYNTSGDKTFMTTNEQNCDRLEILHLTISDAFRQVQYVTECDQYYWPRSGQTYTHNTIDSITVPGGSGMCDSTFVLNLTLHFGDDLYLDPVSACDNYEWYGTTYDESGTYPHETINEWGCVCTEYLPLTIHESETVTLPSVTECDEYVWHGQLYNQSGTYYFDTINQFGCNLRYTLPLTIRHSSQHEFDVTACESYEWYGSVYTEPGIYYHVLENAQGCDSLLIMNLEIGDAFTMEETQVSCGEFVWHGQTYDADGDYSYVVENPDGCDSTFVLHLTVAQDYYEEIERESCYAYTWGLDTYTESGDYEQSFQSQMGCDSTVLLHLTITDAVRQEFDQQTCLPFVWNGMTYYEDGDYEQTFTAHNGCDSIVTMHLHFSEAMSSDFAFQSCQEYDWYEYHCDQDGDYTHVFESVQGCDSIVTMHFRLSDAMEHEFDSIACAPFEWYQHTCLDGMTYSVTLDSSLGCDSIVTMHTQIIQTVTENAFLTVCDSVEWNGVVHYDDFIGYGETLFSQQGCDSIIYKYHYTVNSSQNSYLIQGESQVYVASDLISGLYRYYMNSSDILSFDSWELSNPDWRIVETYENGCLLFVGAPGTAELTVSFYSLSCGETTRTLRINAGYFGVNENVVEAKIFPNPTNGNLTIEAKEITGIKVVDALGQILAAQEYGKENHVSLNLSSLKPALYLLEIETTMGKTVKQVSVNR